MKKRKSTLILNTKILILNIKYYINILKWILNFVSSNFFITLLFINYNWYAMKYNK